MITISCLHAGFVVSDEFKIKPVQRLDEELQKEFLKLNRWGYSVVFFPTMTRHGYTYSFNLLINLYGVRIEEISEAEKLHSDIYEDSLSKIHSLKCIRPFLANFPLTPDSLIVSVGFADERGVQLAPPYLVSVIMRSEMMEFNMTNKADIIHPFKTILTKPIADSTLLRPFYHCGVPRKPCVEKPHVPVIGHGGRWASDKFIKKLVDSYFVFLHHLAA